MDKKTKVLYEFGEFEVDPAERTVRRRGEIVPIKAKVFDLLVLLLRNGGSLLEKEWLIGQLWPNSFVEEVNLNVNISTLRKALGETPARPLYIETVPKKGYRFVAVIVERSVPAAHPEKLDAEPFAAAREGPEAAPAGAKGVVRRRPAWLRVFAAILLFAIPGLGAYLFFALRDVGYLVPRLGRGLPAAPAAKQMLAVLPFKTASADEADQALGLGMANELIRRLSNLRQVAVRPTSSVLKYSAPASDPIAAGRELGVDVVLDGLVQRSDKQVRISAQMLRVADGAVMWSVRFDDYFTNVFAVQDSISEKLTEALALQLTSREQQLLTRRHTENTEAFQLYLLGQYLTNKPGHQWQRALDYFQASIAKDPEYAPAYAGLADVYYTMGEQGAGREAMRAKAREAIEEALRLDPGLANAYSTRSLLKLSHDYDWAGAEEDARRAIELNPNNPDVHNGYARLLSMQGRHDEAIRVIQTALQLDATFTPANSSYAEILRDARRYDEAIAQVRRVLELDPASTTANRLMGICYCLAARFDEALAALRKDVDEAGRPRVTSGLIFTLARGGRRAEARRLLEQYRARVGKPGFAGNYHGLAMGYTALGDRDGALAALEKSFASREYPVLHIKANPMWDDLRPDPRFRDLLRRMKLD